MFGILSQWGMRSENVRDAFFMQDDAQQHAKDLQTQAQQFNSAPAQYDRLVSIGINPNMAASSVLGYSGVTSPVGGTGISPIPDNGISAMLGSSSAAFEMLQDVLMNKELKQSEAAVNRANARGIDLENEWLPITRETQIRKWDSEISRNSYASLLDDSMKKYYDELGEWVTPLSQSEMIESYSRTFQALANIDLIKEQINTEVSEQAVNYNQVRVGESVINVNDSVITLNEALADEAKARKVLVDRQARHQFYQNLMAYFDVKNRQAISGLPMPDELKEYLIVLKTIGTNQQQQNADNIFKQYFQFSRDLYDEQVNNHWRNWGKNFVNDFGVKDLIPNVIITPGGAGYVPTPGSRGPNTTRSSSAPKRAMPTPSEINPKYMGKVKRNGGIYDKYLQPDGTYSYFPNKH